MMRFVHLDNSESHEHLAPYLVRALNTQPIMETDPDKLIFTRELEGANGLLVSSDVADEKQIEHLVQAMTNEGRMDAVILLDGGRPVPEAKKLVEARGGLVLSKGNKPRQVAVAIRDHLRKVEKASAQRFAATEGKC